jgi:hypothetical protein
MIHNSEKIDLFYDRLTQNGRKVIRQTKTSFIALMNESEILAICFFLRLYIKGGSCNEYQSWTDFV